MKGRVGNMGILGLSNFILILLTGIIIYVAWFNAKNVVKQREISVAGYVFLLGIVPLSSFFLIYFIITTSFLDFFGYILVILFACFVFISTWIFIALNGEHKKVELSMNIVIAIISLIFMMLMGLIEALPNEILEFFLKPLISMGSKYDIWSRPPYQLAHFLTFAISFPYMTSFIISKVVLSFRKYKMGVNTYN
ncbi:hypothetical protein UT300007_22440 [Clostridium sp. CTA-7]